MNDKQPVRVADVTGEARAEILRALRQGRIWWPYAHSNREPITIEDLDAHATYLDGKVRLGGLDFPVT